MRSPPQFDICYSERSSANVTAGFFILILFRPWRNLSFFHDKIVLLILTYFGYSYCKWLFWSINLIFAGFFCCSAMHCGSVAGSRTSQCTSFRLLYQCIPYSFISLGPLSWYSFSFLQHVPFLLHFLPLRDEGLLLQLGGFLLIIIFASILFPWMSIFRFQLVD